MSRFVFARHMSGIVSVASVEFGKGEGFFVSVRRDMMQMTFDRKEIYPFKTRWFRILLPSTTLLGGSCSNLTNLVETGGNR